MHPAKAVLHSAISCEAQGQCMWGPGTPACLNCVHHLLGYEPHRAWLRFFGVEASVLAGLHDSFVHFFASCQLIACYDHPGVSQTDWLQICNCLKACATCVTCASAGAAVYMQVVNTTRSLFKTADCFKRTVGFVFLSASIRPSLGCTKTSGTSGAECMLVTTLDLQGYTMTAVAHQPST
eukprot:jgi/Ulvmu1/11066/UM007_0248.1